MECPTWVWAWECKMIRVEMNFWQPNFKGF